MPLGHPVRVIKDGPQLFCWIICLTPPGGEAGGGGGISILSRQGGVGDECMSSSGRCDVKGGSCHVRMTWLREGAMLQVRVQGQSLCGLEECVMGREGKVRMLRRIDKREVSYST